MTLAEIHDQRPKTGSSSQQHYLWATTAQGLGCILVLVGHAIQAVNGPEHAPVLGIANTVIYSFHMPLFFFISGFLSIRLLKMESLQDRAAWLAKRAKRLLIPYFFIAACCVPVRYVVSGYAASEWTVVKLFPGIFLGVNPSTTLWFLWALFVVDTFACFAVRRRSLIPVIGGCIVVVWTCTAVDAFALFAEALGDDVASVLSRTIFNLPIFLLGLLCRSGIEGERWQSCQCKRGLLLGLAFVALVVFVCGNAYQIAAGDTPFFMPLLIAVSGIYLTSVISGALGERADTLNFVGQYCMDIYIMGEPIEVALRVVLYQKMGFDYLPCLVVLVLAAIVLPIMLSRKFIRKSKALSILILGKEKVL